MSSSDLHYSDKKIELSISQRLLLTQINTAHEYLLKITSFYTYNENIVEPNISLLICQLGIMDSGEIFALNTLTTSNLREILKIFLECIFRDPSDEDSGDHLLESLDNIQYWLLVRLGLVELLDELSLPENMDVMKKFRQITAYLLEV